MIVILWFQVKANKQNQPESKNMKNVETVTEAADFLKKNGFNAKVSTCEDSGYQEVYIVVSDRLYTVYDSTSAKHGARSASMLLTIANKYKKMRTEELSIPATDDEF